MTQPERQENLLRMEEMELTKSARGPPGCEELSARSSRFRAPETSGSNDESVTLKSTLQAVSVFVKDGNFALVLS